MKESKREAHQYLQSSIGLIRIIERVYPKRSYRLQTSVGLICRLASLLVSFCGEYNTMDAILGIDAAWQCIAVAPSYDTFIALSHGIPVDWNTPSIPGGAPPVAKLLEATARLTKAHLSVVAIDMPVRRFQSPAVGLRII